MTPEMSPTADDLRPLLKRGLPAAGDAINDRLLDLPGVIARAKTPDRPSRVEAFNTLMQHVLRPLDPAMAAAADLLFFDRSAGSGPSTLTDRRAAAALSLSRDPDHFRKHIEPRLLAMLAGGLAADSARMQKTRATPPWLFPILAPAATLPADAWAWETVEHEEHIARLWAGVYALRAELLACARVASFDPSSQDMGLAAEAALWRYGQLHVAIRTYRRAYGNRLLHGDIDPATLVDLAGWTPPMDPADLDAVCHAGPDIEPCRPYIAHLAATYPGARILGHWLHHLSVHRATTTANAGSAT
jgi:hypothetical protein